MGQRRNHMEIFKLHLTDKNENKTYQNLRDVAKVIFKGKCIVFNTFIKQEKRSKINDLRLCLKKLLRSANEIETKQKEIIKV